jgi:hypothetical protein
VRHHRELNEEDGCWVCIAEEEKEREPKVLSTRTLKLSSMAGLAVVFLFMKFEVAMAS